MASKLESHVLKGWDCKTTESIAASIQAAHDAGREIAPPHEPLIEALEDVRCRGGNLLAASQEVIRAHAYAYFLQGPDNAAKLQENWHTFIAGLQRM